MQFNPHRMLCGAPKALVRLGRVSAAGVWQPDAALRHGYLRCSQGSGRAALSNLSHSQTSSFCPQCSCVHFLLECFNWSLALLEKFLFLAYYI